MRVVAKRDSFAAAAQGGVDGEEKVVVAADGSDFEVEVKLEIEVEVTKATHAASAAFSVCVSGAQWMLKRLVEANDVVGPTLISSTSFSAALNTSTRDLVSPATVCSAVRS